MIWPKCLDKFITRLPLKSSKRVQACLINLPRSRIFWLNSYFPTDPQTPMMILNKEKQLSIKSVIENNQHDQVLWQGDINTDINTDFRRKSKYVEVVKEALEDLNVKSVWNEFPIDFTFCSPTELSFSTIDHSLVRDNLQAV